MRKRNKKNEEEIKRRKNKKGIKKTFSYKLKAYFLILELLHLLFVP